MTPTEYFTLDNPQGRFILGRNAVPLFLALVGENRPECELVFGEMPTDEHGRLFPRQ